MSKKNEMFEFLGKTYSMDKARRVDVTMGSPSTPLVVVGRFGRWEATTTSEFDLRVFRFNHDTGAGRSKLAAIRNLERKCIREFKRIAKVCGYTVSG